MTKKSLPLTCWTLLASLFIFHVTTPTIFAQDDPEDDDLESALLAKITRKRARRHLGKQGKASNSSSSNPSLAQFTSDNKKSISTEVVNTIKNMVKEPLITFLASSEFISWPELKDRFNKAKQALELFELKFRTDFSSIQTPPPPALMGPPQPLVLGTTTPAIPSKIPQPRPVLAPGLTQRPPIQKTPPPTTTPEEESEEEDEEEEQGEEKQTTQKSLPSKAMPSSRPIENPIIKPVTGIQQPIQKPSTKVPGGMPMA